MKLTDKIIVLCNLTDGIDILLEDTSDFEVNKNEKTITFVTNIYPRIVEKFKCKTIEYKPVHGVLFIEYELDKSVKPEHVGVCIC